MPIDNHQMADIAISQKFNLKRSSEWPEVERIFIKIHPRCAACGSTTSLNVHHMFPFHYVVLCGRPDLELDPRNLITLCTASEVQHHLLLGHLDDYESYNPEVLGFVKTDANKTNPQIRSDAAFKIACAQKPKHLDQMTDSDKKAFKQLLDKTFAADPVIVAKAAKAVASQ